MKNLIITTTLIICILAGAGVAAENPLWMRYPSISPDGKTIVFSYKGDLFSVAADGGIASPLTIHKGYDFMPVWSPDGSHIAFASARYGNFDVFIMPSAGGKAIRLTDFSGSEYPACFTPDGQNILYSASIQDDYRNVMFPSGMLSELYSVPVEGGRPVQILSVPAEDAQLSSDGSILAFHDRKGYENSWRKHHTSSVTRDVWLYYKNDDSFVKFSDFEGEDRNPVFSDDDKEIYYLSEKSGSFNIWKNPVQSPMPYQQQLTFFEKHPVRFLSMTVLK